MDVFCLCLSGGVHNGEYVSWLYCYDPVMDVWARKQDMNTKRAIHALAGMNDRLYAIGGNHLKGTRGSVFTKEAEKQVNTARLLGGAGGAVCCFFFPKLCERGAIMSR